MPILGIDVGASKIRFVALEGAEKVAEGVYPNTPPTLEGLTIALTKIKEELQSKNIPVAKIGVGVPGNPQDGTLAAARNFPKLAGFPLAKEIQKIFDVSPAVSVNDAFAFAYAEAKMGAGKDFKRVVGITLGSGLGSGLVIDGKLYNNDDWPAIRQAILNVRNGLDAEDLTSQKFFNNKGLDAQEVAVKAKKGDTEAQNIWQEFGQNLGDFIAGVVNILHPQVIILGGGIADAYDLFIEKTKETSTQFIVNPSSKSVQILRSALGPSAGAVGAALLAGL